MFLRRRSRQVECFDDPTRPAADVARDYAQLDRVNRLFRHADPFTRLLQRDPRSPRWQNAAVLEIGAGTGGLATELLAWSRRRGWAWAYTCLDSNPVGIAANPIPCKVLGDALQLPFPDGTFDLVLASQMTHHLDDPGVIVHLREAWRVTRGSMIISDLHRNLFLLSLVTVTSPILRLSRQLCADGRLSVRRGFRTGEWRRAARAAGIPDARVDVQVQFGCRIVLSAGRP